MSAIGERFLAHHLAFRPVDGTFMGRRECDWRLPRADSQAASEEARAVAELAAAAASAPESTAAERMDKRLAQAELKLAVANLRGRRRHANPAWYTGEALFGIIGLLLPQSTPFNADALAARLAALPDFLADGRARLAEARAAPSFWCERAARETAALAGFLQELVRAPEAAPQVPVARAQEALEEFSGALEGLEDCDPAAGAAYLELVVKDVHGIAGSVENVLAVATAAFDRLGQELVEMAARLTPGRSWQQGVESLAEVAPAADGVLGAYRHWHERAVAAAQEARLVTPATAYGLEYRLLDERFRRVAPATYFLFYRSPPALWPRAGSVYWVAPPTADLGSYLRTQSIATLKTTHTVHHGSIGHHTQNARARAAPGLLARVAGTDCASGIALLSGGTMVEGWACYAEDLLREAGDFYSDVESILLKQNERRNAASVMVDINLHLGRWSVEESARFYRDVAGFAPQRALPETVRNSMFPGSRLMYFCGVEAIKSLRQVSSLPAREFHDALLGFGHVPIAAAAAEMAHLEPA